MKKLVAFLFLSLFISVAHADDVVMLDKKDFDDLVKAAENLSSIEKAVPIMKIEPIKIVTDKDGRVFVDSVMRGTINISYLNYSFEIPLETSVQKKVVKPPIFGLRLKLAGYVDPFSSEDHYVLGVALMAEPIHIGLFGINGFIGSNVSGLAGSVDLTKNFSLYVGAGARYSDWNFTGVFGVAAAF